MRLLLDTHALRWWFTDDDRLSSAVRDAIVDMENQIYVSAASAWEIATKQRIGKLDSVPQAAVRFPELVAADGFLSDGSTDGPTWPQPPFRPAGSSISGSPLRSIPISPSESASHRAWSSR